jgi:late competence protein required for DNA uptake (superfamily II DNA/RNA helicase)
MKKYTCHHCKRETTSENSWIFPSGNLYCNECALPLFVRERDELDARIRMIGYRTKQSKNGEVEK